MDDEQRLIVALEARVTKYERDFDRTVRKTDGNFKTMEKRAQVSGQRMEKHLGDSASAIGKKLEGMFATLSKGGFAVAAIAGTALAIKEIASSVAEVDREARKAGVSAKVWQQWSGVAVATGMSIDGMTDALKELNIRGDEFAKTGKGSAQEAFQRLGYSVSDVAERLKDPSRFIDEIISKLQKLDAAAQTRILDEVFGGTGAEQLAKVLGKSVTEIQTMRAEAATFTTEQIAAAQKIDAEFATMWRNVMVNAKAAAIDSVGYAKDIIGAIRGAGLPGYDTAKGNIDRYSSPEEQLKRLQRQRQAIADEIEREKANTGNVLQQAELRNLEAALKAVDEQIHQATGGSEEFKAAMKELSAATYSLSSGLDTNVASASNFKTALNELKALVPELKAELDTLAQSGAIDTAYQKAMRSARTMSEAMSVTDIANRAKSVATYGKHDNLLDLIGSVESGGDYNATVDNGRWTGGAQNLTGMSLDQVLALGDRMRTPENRAMHPGGGSSALGKYQIVGSTLRGLIKELGLSGDRSFDKDTQDELARALARRRGNDPAELRKEWTGLKRVDDGTIRSAYAGTPLAAQKLQPTDGQQEATALLDQQTAARKSLNLTVQEGLALAQFEQSISGMTVSQQRVELEMFRAKQDAARSGITLSASELAAMHEKISLTEQLNGKNQEVAASSEGLRTAQEYFVDGFTSSLSGLLTGTTTLQGALSGLLNSLIDATLQAALLGKGPLAGLLGGGGAGASSGILGAIFGFADGGGVHGPGTGTSDSIPAWLSDGEFVVNAKSTKANRALLEQINDGKGMRLAAGSYVGTPPTIRQPALKAANNNAPQISINAPVTVNASGGSKEQNADLAKQVQKEMEATMRGVIVSELQQQLRPGNMLSRR